MRTVTSTYTTAERAAIAADNTDRAEARHTALNAPFEPNLASDSPAGRVELADPA